MKNVLLLSGNENSSHLFLGEAKRTAETRQVPLNFKATVMAELTPDLLAEQDLVLLAPQTASEADIAAMNTQVPTVDIPNDIYGWLNGQALVKFACQKLDLGVVGAM
ncbi:PTS sugar transporter subunit IIB [Levilactobacillus angrenensis]|uniref:Cellobiose PTS IIC subunit n=1 Tax=Levilactobacillus angrenensis TaxID=2486020 RepID=A0ABW1U9U6_9LACO|nr:cellobiose PTS IIC subunit [Levilactobacillus angrenensis]